MATIRERLPFIGDAWAHALPLMRDPIRLSEQLRDQGPVVAMKIGWTHIFLLNDPAAIRRVLADNVAQYRKSTRGYAKLRQTLGNGLVTSQGDFWLRQRRIAQPAFRRKALAGFAEIMGRHVDETGDRIAARAARGPLDVVGPLNRMALDIVAEALFGADIRPYAKQIERGVNDLVEPFWLHTTAPYPRPEWVPRPLNLRYWRSRFAMRRAMKTLIADARRRPAGSTDLISMLMAATDPETGEAMSDAQLVDEGLTLIGAGHETTANGMSFGLDLLARHPAVVERVAAEVEQVLGDARRPDAEQILALRYTRQVVDEILRLYPPVWMLARSTAGSDTLCGVEIPDGAYILISVIGVHRDPALWADPERFDPDRFGPDTPAPDRWAYLPFSRGRRQCIGDRFALMEMVCALALICRRFTLAPHGAPPQLRPALTLRTRGPVRVGFTPRR